MNDKPPTDKLDRDKLHASSVWEPSNRKPSQRLVLRLATNALSNRKPSAKHLLFRQVLFSVGMDLNIHASSPPSYPISYDESLLSPISYAGTCWRAGGVARIEGRSNTAQASGQEHIHQGHTFS